MKEYERRGEALYTLKNKIANAGSLQALCDVLNEDRDDTEFPEIIKDIDLSSLPTYGGMEPRRTDGIFSWDEKNFMFFDMEDADYFILPRNEVPAAQNPEEAEDIYELAAILNSGRISEFDACDLPTFGGEEPEDTEGIYSWDEEEVLVVNGEDQEWVVIDREDARGTIDIEDLDE